MPIKFSNQKTSILSMLFFALVLIASAFDMMADIKEGANIGHLIQEAFIVMLALIFFIMMFISFRIQKNKNHDLINELAEITALSQKTSQELLNAKKLFGEEIVKQFTKWQLTESEMDIALFTLKGFNSKEIANLRNVSDKTVRNQLSNIYKKAGLSGKHSFVAWFMDGMF